MGPQNFNPHIEIGNDVHLSDDVHISAINQILIGNHVLFGSHIYVGDHNHGVYLGDSQSLPDEAPSLRSLGGGGPIVIEDNVWIGDHATILGPARIGRGAIVGASSFVKGAVSPNTIVAGAPCRVVRKFDSATRQWRRT